MPIYEYECQACHHYLDVLQKLSDEPLTYCPECGKAEMRKLVSAPSFRLKGGGWYETDFKKDNRRNLADGDGADKQSGKAAKADAPASASTDTAGKDTTKSKPSKPAGSPGASGGGDSA